MKKLLFLSALILNIILMNQSKAQNTEQKRTIFAKALAKSLKREDVRVFLKSEVSKKSTGEEEVLFVMIKDKKVNASETFGSILTKSTSERITKDFFSEILDDEPELSIAIPSLEKVKLGNWDTKNFTPKVCILFDDNSPEVLQYDGGGSPSKISTTISPTVLTVVVQLSDRVVSIDKNTQKSKEGIQKSKLSPVLKSQKLFDNTKKEFYSINFQSVSDINDNTDSPNANKATVTCDRDGKTTKDECSSFKLTPGGFVNSGGYGMGTTLFWIEGPFLEVHLRVLYPDAGLASDGLTIGLNKFYDVPNSLILATTSWKNINVEVTHWDKDINGNKMLYYWEEYDNGNTHSVTVNLGTEIKGVTLSLAGTFDLTNKSDPLGESIVEYCDAANGIGTEYNTGRIRFRVRQK